MIDFYQINVWGAIAGALAAFALCGVWFSPILFGKTWTESLGKPKEELGSWFTALFFAFVTSLLQAFVIAMLFKMAGVDTLILGFESGILIGLIVFISTLPVAGFLGYLKARWWWIQTANRFLGILLICAIVGASAPESAVSRMKKNLQSTGEALQQRLQEFGEKLK